MQQISVEFSDATLESIERVAEDNYEGNRSAAVRSMLAAWLDER